MRRHKRLRPVLVLVALAMMTSSCAWIARASVDSDGVEGNGDSYLGGALAGGRGLSDDGRYVVFVSDASNLVTDDTNGMGDVFVRDNQTGSTELVSTGGAGYTGWFTAPAVSDDGQRMVYNRATICACPEFETQVYYRDLADPEEQLVSAEGFGQDLSADGRHIAFASGLTDHVSGDTNGAFDVFVRNMDTGVTTRVSVDSNGNQAGGGQAPSISANGGRIAFTSGAVDLVPGDTNDADDVFVHDIVTGTTTRVSIDSNGNQADAGSSSPVISADGRYVAFASVASNLVPGDTNAVNDVFVHDTVTGTTTRASVGPSGGQGNFANSNPSISGDGTRVAFASVATFFGLPLGRHIYMRDTAAGTTTRLSLDATGALANGPSRYPALSTDGRFVAFETEATNLVDDDTNAANDIIVRAVVAPTIDTITPDVLTPGTTALTVSGGGFGPGTSVTVAPGVMVDSVSIVSDTRLDVIVTVAAGTASGPRDVSVAVPGPGTGAGGLTSSIGLCPDCLTITP